MMSTHGQGIPGQANDLSLQAVTAIGNLTDRILDGVAHAVEAGFWAALSTMNSDQGTNIIQQGPQANSPMETVTLQQQASHQQMSGQQFSDITDPQLPTHQSPATSQSAHTVLRPPTAPQQLDSNQGAAIPQETSISAGNQPVSSTGVTTSSSTTQSQVGPAPLMSLPIQASLPSTDLSVTSELNMFPTSLISGVPDDIHTTIWEGRYVDLAILIYKQDTAVRFNVQSSDDAPELVLNQRPSKTIKTISDWDRAFAKFHAIYIRRHPALSEALIAHQQQVKKIAYAGGDWLAYDESFRRGVADGSINWGQMNPGLTMDAVLFSNRQPFLGQRGASTSRQQAQNKGQFSTSQVPAGYCFAFHRSNSCGKVGCSWKHTCPHCQGEHSILKCRHASKQGHSDKKRKPDQSSS